MQWIGILQDIQIYVCTSNTYKVNGYLFFVHAYNNHMFRILHILFSLTLNRPLAIWGEMHFVVKYKNEYEYNEQKRQQNKARSHLASRSP